jgi:hypothetical protein
MVADCYRIAIDIGTRGNGRSRTKELETTSVAEPIEEQATPSTGAWEDIVGLHPATFRRRLIFTKTGYLGLAPENVQPGDRVVILMGGQLPFVLRPVDRHHLLVGEAYVQGIMDGEAMERQRHDELFRLS